MRFIAWLVPRSWVRDPWGCGQVPSENPTYVESATLDAQTDEILTVSSNDLQYLTLEEAEQIIDQFEKVPHSSDRLLFWTGLPRDWVRQWADDHGMLTLTSAMGPLMNNADQRCLRRVKNREAWSKYVKGASRIFARYACRRGIVRVLTLPPSWAEFLRPESSYRTIEEPVLKGTSGYHCAVQINTVHLLAPLEELEYQTWPENRIPESLRCGAADSLNFRLPPWIRKAAKKATDSLRSNVLSFTACPILKPAGINLVLQGSVRKAGKSQTAKQSKGCEQSGSHANAKASLQPRSQQPQSKKQQPQSKQPQSKKKQQPQSQQPQSKKQQPQSQQPQSKKQQPQSQQPQSQQPQSNKKLLVKV
jgi:hypothetical protein